MPWVFPQHLNERYGSRYRTEARASQGHYSMLKLQKKKGLTLRKSRCPYRIVLFSLIPEPPAQSYADSHSHHKRSDDDEDGVVHAVGGGSGSAEVIPTREDRKTRMVVALSGNSEDTLEQEWKYIILQLPLVLPKDYEEMSFLTRFNWLLSHLSWLFEKQMGTASELLPASFPSVIQINDAPRASGIVDDDDEKNLLAGSSSAFNNPSSLASSQVWGDSLPLGASPHPEGPPRFSSVSTSSEALMIAKSPAPREHIEREEKKLQEMHRVVHALQMEASESENKNEEHQSLVEESRRRQEIRPMSPHVKESWGIWQQFCLLIKEDFFAFACVVVVNLLAVLGFRFQPFPTFVAVLMLFNTISWQLWVHQRAAVLVNSSSRRRTRTTSSPFSAQRRVEVLEPIPESPVVGRVEEDQSRPSNPISTHVADESKTVSVSRPSQRYPTILPGQTLVYVNEITEDSLTDEERDSRKLFGEWKKYPGSSMIVRVGPDYPVHKRKAPSDDPLYETIFVDVYGLKKKIFHVGRFFDLGIVGTCDRPVPVTDDLSLNNELSEMKAPSTDVPSLQVPSNGAQVEPSISASASEVFQLPKYLVFCVVCPLYAPSMVYSVNDGEGFMVTFFGRLSQDSHEKIESGDLSPALELVKAYMDAEKDNEFRSRLKGIGKVTNIDQLNWGRMLGNLIRKYNATPFLNRVRGNPATDELRVFKGTGVSRATGEVYDYWEIDLDLHHFGTVSRNGFFYMKEILPKIRAQFAFLIEGRTNDELPEQLLVSAEVFGVENIHPKEFPIAEHHWSIE